MGRLTGIMDERGKFIFISPQDMATIADFMRTKGRVSKSELTTFLNETVNLTPEHDDNDDEGTINNETSSSGTNHLQRDDTASHTRVL